MAAGTTRALLEKKRHWTPLRKIKESVALRSRKRYRKKIKPTPPELVNWQQFNKNSRKEKKPSRGIRIRRLFSHCQGRKSQSSGQKQRP